MTESAFHFKLRAVTKTFDRWGAYVSVQKKPDYPNLTVNHIVNFVDHDTSSIILSITLAFSRAEKDENAGHVSFHAGIYISVNSLGTSACETLTLLIFGSQ